MWHGREGESTARSEKRIWESRPVARAVKLPSLAALLFERGGEPWPKYLIIYYRRTKKIAAEI
jgi:hypothetical protein